MCSGATLVCRLPLPRYLEEKCCTECSHIDNHGDANFQDIFLEAADAVKGCLEAAFPGAIIFEPLTAFGGSKETDLVELVSSDGLSVWNSGDPVHLTLTAYGDQAQPRRRIESVATRATVPAATAPTLGWIMGDNRSAGGRGGPGRGFGGGARGRGSRGGQGGRGRQPGWSRTGANH